LLTIIKEIKVDRLIVDAFQQRLLEPPHTVSEISSMFVLVDLLSSPASSLL
jgi:hypothetical protein